MTRMSIAAVERDTGLSKDLLRVWERRYGFPRPERGPGGERLYPLEQLERLRVIRRLIDRGHRPGRIVGLPIDALRELAGPVRTAAPESETSVAASPADPGAPAAAGAPGGTVQGVEAGQDPVEADFTRFMSMVKGLRTEDLRQALSQAAWRLGLERFVTRLCAPLTRRVGDAWAAGAIEIYEEHLYTEAVQGVLRGAIGGLGVRSGEPRVLLATVPFELHGLGLLMAEALLALEGCRCASLGTQTPVVDIARAALAQPTDVVALSFSPSLPAGQVVGGLEELRALLPPSIEIWAGGRNAALQRRPPAGVVVLDELEALRPRLEAWRAARAD